MPSKVPPRRPPTSVNPPTVKTVQPTEIVGTATINTAARFSDTFKKRRLGVWAVGVAIIVGAGAITGGELRERQKVKERAAARVTGQDDVAEKVSEAVVASRQNKPTDEAATVPHPQAQSTLSTIQQAPANMDNATSTGGRGASYDQRQVAYLEDRRAVLMKQKFDVEKKLERVREKKRIEKEVEGRRSTAFRSVER